MLQKRLDRAMVAKAELSAEASAKTSMVSTPPRHSRDDHCQQSQPGQEAVTPEKTSTTAAAGGSADSVRTESVPLTADELEWLTAAAGRHGHADISALMRRLIDWANAEPPEAKKHIFLVIRCRRCSAGARGGVKSNHDLELRTEQWQWLESVRGRCGHASVGKTVRIITDFYMPLCQEDSTFEQKVLRVGSTSKSQRLADAVGAVGSVGPSSHGTSA